jgi:PDZ domain-containing protein
MRRPSRTTMFVIGGVAIAAVLLASSWITVPFYGVGPGPAREVTPLISFEGPERHDPAGKLIMTTVRVRHLTPITALAAWLDPEVTVAAESLIYPPGLDPVEESRISFSQMDQSKIDATAVVLGLLANYPDDHGAGALIESTSERCPADGHLFPGDVVTAIDDEPIDSKAEASRIIARTPEGTDLTFALDVDGASEEAVFARERCIEGDAGVFVGVVMLDTFPFPVQIASGDVGGPSAGLMWAIGLYELLTPGDLTQGRVVAGTGTLGLDGSVGGIGSVVDKVLGAEHAGANIFLVPKANAQELAGIDTGSMEVVPVATLDDAIGALEGTSPQG